MNALDYAVLLAAILGIAAYGVVRSYLRRRQHRTLETYLQGARDSHWLVIGLSVMATQASAITFLSTPGQGYESGLSFVQNYFGAPFALIVISAVFLPLYRKLNVYTAYEFLGKRFDTKTRLLAAFLFLLQRGLGAGITLYAPAIVLSTVFGWSLPLTIIASGVVVTAYTVAGGSDAVTHTQKYQLAIIFAGMIAAFVILVRAVTQHVTIPEAFTLAGHLGKLNAVSFSTDPKARYTLWTGLLGGFFLALSYFGTDQSQVQRYIAGPSLKESRLGLMFNAVAKIPMQFFILLLGVFLFLFYQFETPPVVFNQTAWNRVLSSQPLARTYESLLASEHEERAHRIREWLIEKSSGQTVPELSDLLQPTQSDLDRRETVHRYVAQANLGAKSNDADYVFITFILRKLPHGLIGLLVAAFFAATLSSKAGELSALTSTTIVDLYRHLIKPAAPDAHYLRASKVITLAWGGVAIGVALFASFASNLIEATNILGSLFYGVVLALFLTAFFLKRVSGTAIFAAAILAEGLVLAMYFTLPISYLWYNLLGCAACLGIAVLIQLFLTKRPQPPGFEIVPVGPGSS